MIRRLRILDIDAFMDIVDDAFIQELRHMGSEYGQSRNEMRVTYFLTRLLQTLCGNIRDAPDIFAYYDEGSVLGITKVIPLNARKDHWYSEMTVVRQNLQKKGTGTALKAYTVDHYSTKARRLFGTVREENIPMLKTNTRVGYNPYMKKVLYTKDAPHTSEGDIKVKGFRSFKNDGKDVYDLYVKRTPRNIVEIEDKTPEDFGYGTLLKFLSLLERIRGKKDKKFVIERNGHICAYFYFEEIGSHFENLEILLDPEVESISESVLQVLAAVSPDRNIICYVPEYREIERDALLTCGFSKEDVYICMVVECE